MNKIYFHRTRRINDNNISTKHHNANLRSNEKTESEKYISVDYNDEKQILIYIQVVQKIF